ncbi:MAG: molybdopterin molybdotransferase MoeA [Deltaproteobacteria bacterium]|nr:molybdopterin molybdotransferase MoeA [Deltaproteobacteria bacterium]
MKDFFHLISASKFAELFNHFTELEAEMIPLPAALGRFLARDITAPVALPPFSRSTMDGYAVRANDTFGCSATAPALLTVKGEIAMGRSGRHIALNPGQTARILTGGELAENADSVVMIEYTRPLDQTTVAVLSPVAPGENVIRHGADFQQGETILTKGRRLRPQDLGALAGLGVMEVAVCKRPVVAIISTGDELASHDRELDPGQIRDINTTTLTALVNEAGGIALPLGITRDNFAELLHACRTAIARPVDMLLLSGGSSAGKRDFTLAVFKELDQTGLLARGVALRPEKPTILAQHDNCALFGLPGHVDSAMVVFYLFVRPLLHRLCGACNAGLQRIVAKAGEKIPSAGGREGHVRVRLEQRADSLLPVAWPVYGGAGLIKPLVTADGLLIIDRNRDGVNKGEQAEVLLFP